MTIDAERLMAYADGELGPIEAKRVELAIAAVPSLAQEVEAHRALRSRVAQAYAPVAAEGVPDRLTALLASNVVALPRLQRAPRWWPALGAAAAAVLVAVFAWPTRQPQSAVLGPALAATLDRELASSTGDPHVLVSFRDRSGAFCRVFQGSSGDGIACREQQGWRIAHQVSGLVRDRSEYRQAGSTDAALLTEAQSMMGGEPLDAVGEREARARGWR